MRNASQAGLSRVMKQLDLVTAERDRLREALEGIAATDHSMVYASVARGLPSEEWVHWRHQATRALAAEKMHSPLDNA